MLGRLFTSIVQAFPRGMPMGQITQSAAVAPAFNTPWSLTLVRTKIRHHFPRPDERKRIKRHGWFARMSTPGGRKVLMRRILKGRRELSH